MKKNSNKGLVITAITLLALIVVALVILMTKLINGDLKNPFRSGYTISKELVLDETYEIPFSELKIDSGEGDIEVKTSSDGKTRVVIYGEKKVVDVNTNNDILDIIVEDETCFGFCFNTKVNKIEVYLPASYANPIHIENDYGDVFVGAFPNSNINIEEDCGNVEILEGYTVRVSNEFGKVDIGKASDVEVKESAGDVYVKTADIIKVDNDLGKIIVENVNCHMDLRNHCGDIEVKNVNILKDSYISDDLGRIKIGNTNEIFIDAKTSLGDVDINNNYRKSDITLKLENDCGNIEVKN